MTKLAEPRALEQYREALLAGADPSRTCVYVCGGTNCRDGNGLAVAEEFRRVLADKSVAGDVAVRVTGCHGFCEHGPLVVLLPAGTLYVGVEPGDVQTIVETSIEGDGVVKKLTYRDPASKKRIASEAELPFYAGQTRVLLRDSGRLDPTSIDDYIAAGGYSALVHVLTGMAPAEVIDAVERAGLRGRGGDGSPVASKWRACRQADGPPKYVLCSGDEGDPDASMDHRIAADHPHAVLEGMAIGAYAVGADRGYVCVRPDRPVAAEHLRIAIRQAEECGLLGERVLGTDLNITVRVSRAPGVFIGGETAALVAAIEDASGEPLAEPVGTSERDGRDLPTAIDNAESWANVPVIIREGWEWYSGIGSGNSKGTKVLALAGKVKNAGLVEVPLGITWREIIYDIGGGVAGDRPLKAVQTGGLSGGCLPEDKLDLPVEFDAGAESGSVLGSGDVVVMDDHSCVVEAARHFAEVFASAGPRNCTACREGLPRMLELLESITAGEGEEEDLDALAAVVESVREGCTCGQGTIAPNRTLSTLELFRDEYLAHAVDHVCPAGVCRALTTFVIDEERCLGCGKCLSACPEHAIEGQRKVAHVIDQGKCTQCGSCREQCPIDGIEVAGHDVLVEDGVGSEAVAADVEVELIACDLCGGPFATTQELESFEEKPPGKYSVENICVDCRRSRAAGRLFKATRKARPTGSASLRGQTK